MSLRIPLLVLNLVVCSSWAFAIDLTPAMRTRLQNVVSTFQQQRKIKGVSAAVVAGNGTFRMVAGESVVGRPITPDMVFGIGSVTKTLTATTLLLMQERGLLDLDDEISKWISAHPNIDLTITVRQLLNHTSGLSDFSATTEYRNAVLANTNRIFTPDELLAFIKEPLTPKGSAMNYCNTNYLLAGIIMTKISGANAGSTYREYLFSKLAMDSTFMGVEDSLTLDVAVRWMGTQSGEGVSINAAFSGAWTAGAVFSTAAEIGSFMKLLQRGDVLREESLKEMHTYPDTNEYGLGASHNMLAGVDVLGHTGSIRGYESIVLYVPSLDVGIAVLVNQGPSEPVGLAAQLIDVLTQETSVEEQLQASVITVAPNPANSSVTISCPVDVQLLRLYDVHGCIVYEATKPLIVDNIDVSNLAHGMYSVSAYGIDGLVRSTAFVK